MPRAQPTPNTAPRGEAGDYEEIEIPNKLLKKVGPGVGPNPGALLRAESVVDKMKGVYEKRLQEELEHLLSDYEKMKASNAFDLDLLHDQVHEIRGEAGTFGYNLVSDIGKLLCELVSPMGTVGPQEDLAIVTHLNAMQTVVSQKVKGAGPEVAKQIVEGLNAIVERSRK